MSNGQSFFTRLFGSFRKKTADAYGAGWVSFLLGKINRQDYYQGLVFSCVDIIAKKASSVPFVLVKKQKDDRSLILDDDDEIVASHPIIDLLQRPNVQHTWTTFSYLLFTYLALHGESFLLPNNSMDGNKVKELFLLNPLNIQIDRGTTNYEPIKKYRYTGYGMNREFSPEQIIPIIQPNPYNDLRGVSPIQMAESDIKSELLAKKWNNKFYENGGSPSGIFKIATNDAAAFKKAQDEIKSKYTGIDNAFKMFILNKDSDFKNITPSQKDMDFVAQMGLSEKRIHKIFKVPDIFLGDAESAKYSNAEVAKRIFGETVTLPMLTLGYDALNTFLLPKIVGSEDVKLKFHNPVPEDRDLVLKQLEQDRKDLETSFSFTKLNEIREQKGLDSIPGGDEIVDVYLSKKAATVVTDPAPKKTLLSKSVTSDKYEKARDAFIEKNQKAHTTKLKAHFGKLYLAINLNQYTKALLAKAQDEPADWEVEQYLDKIVPDTEQWRIDLAALIAVFGLLAIDDSINNSSETFNISVDFNLVHEEAVKWLKNRALEASNSVRDTLLNRAREIIARNLSERVTDIQKIKEELLTVFKDEEAWRVERIYRSEMMNAYAKGSVKSYLDAGIKKHTWNTIDPCDLCKMNSNVTVEIGMDFPSGHTEPTAHPNCMCSTSPVIES